MKDLGEQVTDRGVRELFADADRDNSGSIEFEEFNQLIIRYLKALQEYGDTGYPPFAWEADAKAGRACMDASTLLSCVDPSDDVDSPRDNPFDDQAEGDEDDEEEEVPEDLKYLSPEKQQFQIKLRAAYKMAFGTLLVLVFSDPAVEVLSAIGTICNISPFYVSFVLAPFASNASELVAAYTYAAKKTEATISISLATLLGAACMNNTWCLGIFFGIVYARQLYWSFTAEVLAIVIIQVLVGLIAKKPVMRMIDAYVVLSLYPLSLAFVWVLENCFGMD
mmetsp:Transcript_5711/g.13891  ORF Transcript_5711/g.13891 Transcript_5711/m.13891 type:complete len:279 (+) Transcript_5711:894-1730(+)